MTVGKKIATVVNHDRWTVLGLTLAVVAGLFILGCQSRTSSVVDPEQQVTRVQLGAEVETIKAQAVADAAKLEAGFADLDAQDADKLAIRQALSGFVGLAATGRATPANAVGTLLTLLSVGGGFGIGMDSLRKNRNIKERDAKIKVLEADALKT